MSQIVLPPRTTRGLGLYLNTTTALTANAWTYWGSGKQTALPWYPSSAIGSYSVFLGPTYYGLQIPSGFSNTSITIKGIATISHNSSVGLGIIFGRANSNIGYSGASPNGYMEYSITTTATTNDVIYMGVWVTDTGDSALAGEMNTCFWIEY